MRINLIIPGIIVIAGSLLISCTSGKATTTVTNYSENISVLRPEFETFGEEADSSDTTISSEQNQSSAKIPQKDITNDVDGFLAAAIEKNRDIDYINGYTIQIYSGSSRENADMIKSEIYKKMPTARPKVEWVAPNFKVRVGSYVEKIEAVKTYAELKSHFPQAILIPARIPNEVVSRKNEK